MLVKGSLFRTTLEQDFCLEFATDPNLEEVWFESQDDITLLRKGACGLEVEFVQVKSDEPSQLWSVAMLCEREVADRKPRKGSSILEKSLQYDRCSEVTRFRIITARPVQSVFEPLTYPYGSEERNAAAEKLRILQDELEPKVGDYTSPNGNTCRQWTERAQWDVRHSEKSVSDANLNMLRKVLEAEGIIAMQEQLQEIYLRLVTRVAQASRLVEPSRRNEKKFQREEWLKWLIMISRNYLKPASVGGKKMREKLEAAKLSPEIIESAAEQRINYRERALNPQFLDLRSLRQAEGDIVGILHRLMAKLDGGSFPDDGAKFHEICLDALEAYQNKLSMETRLDLATIHGIMYNVTDRCLHRFRRVVV